MLHVECLERLFSDEETESTESVVLLKKLFFLMHHGELRINGQLPNREFMISDYFLDDYRLMVDWSALSPDNQKKLKQWLLVLHSASMKTRFSDFLRIDETSGRPEEKRLNLWGWFINSTLFKRRYYQWDLPHDSLSTVFELKSIQNCLARAGAIFDFVPKFSVLDRDISPASREYVATNAKRNIKRLLLDNEIISKLENFESFEFTKHLHSPHPMAIKVRSPHLRAARMKAHRDNHRYDLGSSVIQFFKHWAALFKRWFFADHWFLKLLARKQHDPPKKEYVPFISDKDVFVELDRRTGEVFVRERRPKFNTFVLCGGGARIYGHLGAIEEFARHNLYADNYAGSSAGAIMALMLYLGYSPSEIKTLFQWFRQENLLEYSVQLSGLSTANKLKQAFDWAIYNKLLTEIERFKPLFATEKGKNFLKEHIYPPNKITFNTLYQFKKFCPACSLKESLLVTATHKKSEVTHYFSHKESPNYEVSEAVTASASLPVVYQPRGEYIDGGVTNNLPLNYYQQDENTFLEHVLRANYKVMAFQFDTGCEHEILFSGRRVFREGYLQNKLYSFLTGVTSPADAWMLERRHLRRYAPQTIIIDVEGVKVSRFDVDKETCDYMLKQGGKAAIDYIKAHFSEKDGVFHRDEAMYQTFENLEELILYANRRKRYSLIDKLERQIKKDVELLDREPLLDLIKQLKEKRVEKPKKNTANTRLERLSSKQGKYESERWHSFTETESLSSLKLFQLLFPILAQNWNVLLPNETSKTNKKNLELKKFIHRLVEIRNALSLESAESSFVKLRALLDKLQGPCHLLVYLLKWSLKDFSAKDVEASACRVRKLAFAFNSPIWQSKRAGVQFSADWSSYRLSDENCESLLDLMQGEDDLTTFFVQAIKQKSFVKEQHSPLGLFMPLSRNDQLKSPKSTKLNAYSL